MFKTISLLIPICIFLATNVFSIDTDAEGYKFEQHDYAKKDLHSNCRFVHRTHATAMFVTTKTSTEWTAFFTNAPYGVTANDCGFLYPGTYTHSTQKFYMAQDYDSCDTRCTDLGGCVSAGFSLITSHSLCLTIVEGIIGSTPAYTDEANKSIDYTNNNPDTNPNSPSTTLGCTFYESTEVKVGAVQVRRFSSNTATCDAMTTTEGYKRVCPCAN